MSLRGTTAVIVLGVHRSGTSALTRALEALGVHLGDNHLAPAEKENPKGFFEDKDILAFNERLLAKLESFWDSVAPLPEHWHEMPEIRALFPEAEALLTRLFSGHGYWGFKDPRTCVTVPFWQEVFRRLGAEARYVFAVRHPMSVEQSLTARNGFMREKSHLLWLGNILPAVQKTMGAKRLFVDFDRLLADPASELSRLAHFLGVDPAARKTEIREYVEAFLSAELRHSVFTPQTLDEEPAASAVERRAYAWLREAAAGEADDTSWQPLYAAWKEWRSALRFAADTDKALQESQRAHAEDREHLAYARDLIAEHVKTIARHEETLSRLQQEKDELLMAANRHEQMRLEDAVNYDAILEAWLFGEARRIQADIARDMNVFLTSRLFRVLVRLKRARDRYRRAENTLPLSTLLESQWKQLSQMLGAEKPNIDACASAAHLLENSLRQVFFHPVYRLLALGLRVTPVLRRSLRHAPILGHLSHLVWMLRQLHAVPRAAAQLSDQIARRRETALPAWRPSASTPQVDVVLPVYKGLEETMACIASVFRSRCRTPFELVVVDDASPEPAIAAALDKLAAEGRITLLRNEQNLGFIGAVNRGMTLHDDRDVVLLNSDTEVYGDWLDRLVKAADSGVDIATVTPMSNNAEICSYPFLCQDNPLPADADAEALDAYASSANSGYTVDVPTGVGFCMLIRRKALKEVGLFDQERFGKGYGEENDFCMRAAKAGYRHLLAGDVFVFHKGGVSFSESKLASVQRAQEMLHRLHPGYHAAVAHHIRRDAQFGLRRNLDLARLKHAAPNKELWLFTLHNFGGGTEKHAQDMIRLLAPEGVGVVILKRPAGSDHIVLEREGLAPTPNARFGPHEWEALVSALKSMGIRHVHFHHWVGLPAMVRDLPSRLGVRFDVTLHDYYPVCPRVNMNNETRRYCGEPPATDCTACIRRNGSHDGHDIDVPAWRGMYAAWLTSARRVYAPSHDVERRTQRYFPDLEITYRPHPEIDLTPHGAFLPRRPKDALRVAILGAIGPHKGSDVLLALAKDAKKRRLPISFHVVGYADNEAALRRTGKVTLTGKYAASEVFDLLLAQSCHLALFTSVFPETYCYTLTTALQAKLYPVALDIGAVPERLKALRYGDILPYGADASTLNDLLLAVSPRPAPEGLLESVQNHYPSFIRDYYGFSEARREAAA
ncbi:MAG: glycosyltransferase [Alphaproteobacteria bacterium]|nr:glycosyltransferase [Alphaproteobacteria bacterium]